MSSSWGMKLSARLARMQPVRLTELASAWLHSAIVGPPWESTTFTAKSSPFPPLGTTTNDPIRPLSVHAVVTTDAGRPSRSAPNFPTCAVVFGSSSHGTSVDNSTVTCEGVRHPSAMERIETAKRRSKFRISDLVFRILLAEGTDE